MRNKIHLNNTKSWGTPECLYSGRGAWLRAGPFGFARCRSCSSPPAPLPTAFGLGRGAKPLRLRLRWMSQVRRDRRLSGSVWHSPASKVSLLYSPPQGKLPQSTLRIVMGIASDSGGQTPTPKSVGSSEVKVSMIPPLSTSAWLGV